MLVPPWEARNPIFRLSTCIVLLHHEGSSGPALEHRHRSDAYLNIPGIVSATCRVREKITSAIASST
jgi:hypothetical protein